MDEESSYRRRGFLLGVTAALAGCQTTAAPAGRPQVATDRPQCASGFEITDQTAFIQTGSVPEVELSVRNSGSEPVTYDITVTFEQKTSLGLAEPTGKARLTGTLRPGVTETLTATDDAYEIENTDEYTLDVSLACAAAKATGSE